MHNTILIIFMMVLTAVPASAQFYTITKDSALTAEKLAVTNETADSITLASQEISVNLIGSVEARKDENHGYNSLNARKSDDKPVEEIVFWVSEASSPYIITKPIHGSMRHLKDLKADMLRVKYPSLPQGEFFSIECIENYELIRELTTYGANLIVLSPSNIVEQVASIAAEMNERYKALTANNEFVYPS